VSQIPNQPGELGSTGPPQPVVLLPPGVQIAPGRETSQLGPNNVTVPGMNFNLTLPNGATTSCFVPYAIIHNTAQVSQLFANRVNAINAVQALGAATS
jgi:hypothetical protein